MSTISKPQHHEARLIHGLILLVTSGLTVLATAVLGPIVPKMQLHFSAVPNADFLVPLVMTAPMLVMAVLSIFAGGLADKYGRKRLLVLSTFAYAFVGTAPMWLESLDSIIGSRILMGVAEAFLMTISTTMIGDYYAGEKRQKFVTLQTTTASVLATLLNIAGGMLGEHGWRAPFAVYSISIPLAALMAVYLWETVKTKGHPEEDHVEDDPGVTFRPKRLAGICAIAVLIGISFMVVPVHFGLLFSALGVNSTSDIGMAFALNSVGVVTGTLTFGWVIGKRCSVTLQLVLAFLVAGLGFLLMSKANTFGILALGGMLNGFGEGLLLPTGVTWNMRELPFAHRGLGVGAFQSSLFLGMFLNAFILVGLDHAMGSRAAAVGVVGFTFLAFSVIALLTRRTG